MVWGIDWYEFYEIKVLEGYVLLEELFVFSVMEEDVGVLIWLEVLNCLVW